MNIRRFSAPTMREAITKIRAELGADAVIVRNLKTATGVDVVAATDYDPGLAESLNPAAVTDEPARAPTIVSAETRAAAARVLGTAAQKPALEPTPLSSLEQQERPAEKRSGRVDITLDDSYPDLPTNEALPQTPAISAVSPTPPEPLHDASVPKHEDSAAAGSNRLDDVGAELRSLRGLVEQQLSGLAWQNVRQRNPQRAHILTRLLEFGMSPDLCTKIVNRMPFGDSVEASWENAKAEIIRKIPVAADPAPLESGGVVALVGPTGAGKTTTIAKLAGAYILRHGPGSVGLITTDDYRLGAHEQLQAFGRILDISVARARDGASLLSAVRSFRGRSLILIDTEGGQSREQQRMLSELAMTECAARIYVVLAASMQRNTLARTVLHHRDANVRGAIVTKLDECGTVGDALSTLIAANLPVAYITDGPQVPTDLHSASALNLVSRGEELFAHADTGLEDELLGLTFRTMAAVANV